MCQKFYKDQCIPSWTSYSISIKSSEVILESWISYLEYIIAPATGISNVNEVLEQALKMKTSPNLKSIVCVFDQSIFAKATEIKRNEPTKFQDFFDNALHVSYNNDVYGSDLQTVQRCWIKRSCHTIGFAAWRLCGSSFVKENVQKRCQSIQANVWSPLFFVFECHGRFLQRWLLE